MKGFILRKETVATLSNEDARTAPKKKILNLRCEIQPFLYNFLIEFIRTFSPYQKKQFIIGFKGM